MLGAIIGDIVGSIYEFNNIKTKNFELFKENSHFTDDTVMTIAVGKAIIDCKGNYKDLSEKTIHMMQHFGKLYPYVGYGRMFYRWIFDPNPKPYESFGNGSAMRASACGIVANSIEETKYLSRIVTEVTHNHPESIRAAEAVAVAIYLAKNGKSKNEIKEVIKNEYYSLDVTIEELVKSYRFNETAQDTTPQAFIAFFESNDFEDAIRNAICIGGDSDTLAAITGSIAAAYYGIPEEIAYVAKNKLDAFLKRNLRDFEKVFQSNITDKTSII